MLWFGLRPFGPICDTNPRIDVPVGYSCTWCEELIGAEDSGFLQPGHVDEPPALAVFHRECMLRMVVGGVNHQRGTCTCCGGTEPPDPEGATRREAAQIAAGWRHMVRN